MADAGVMNAVGFGVAGVDPVRPNERNRAIDALRGFALLGILVMNIPVYGLSHFAFMTPPIDGGFAGADYAAWLGSHLFFDLKMMAIFSMLFGAGFMLMLDRAAARGRSAVGTYYRRIGWLAVIGLLHAYVFWYGDILFTYALCGAVLYPLRRLPAVWLAVIAAALMSVAILASVGMGAMFSLMRDSSPDQFAEVLEGFTPPAEVLAEERATMLGSYLGYAALNAKHAIMMQTFLFVIWGAWRIVGLMLLGIALLKWGVLSGMRSQRFYTVLAAVGFAVGLPIVWIGAQRLVASNFDVAEMFLINWHFNYIGSVAVALGWIGVVMLVVKSGMLGWLVSALAAVGRMALSNYLAHTLICTTLFCGWGFGWWGSLSRAELLIVVAAIWAAQLIWSPLWLARFRFGPAEWVWRSLTYWKAQPMRLEASRA